MIEIVLDQHRNDESPLILIGTLPCVTFEETQAHVHLSLVDDRPVIEVSLTRISDKIMDFYFSLRSEREFTAWKEIANDLGLPYAQRSSGPNGTRPATSSARQPIEVTVVWNNWPVNVRFHTYPSRVFGVEGHNFPLWGDEFGRILELALAIDRYVTRVHDEQREALLQHIDGLLVRSVLS